MALFSAAFGRRTCCLVLVVMAALAGTTTATAAAGDLDPSFGVGGKVVTTATAGFGDAILVQPDGRIVVAGGTGLDFLVVRYLADGSLDTSFGDAGVVTTDVGAFDGAQSAALQPDGAIVTAGISWGTDTPAAVARYLPDGGLDPSFAAGGSERIPLPGGSGQIWSVLVQADGKLVLVGSSAAGIDLVRLLPDGALDASFGVGGIVTTPVGAGASAPAAVLLPDGRIVAAGAANGDVLVARYLPDGRLDASFGAEGIVLRDFGGSESATGAALQGGRLVVAASVDYRTGTFVLLRYADGGALDSTFGSGGVAAATFAGGGFPFDLAVAGAGRLVVGGAATVDGATAFGLARFTPDGALDGTFGTGGFATTTFDSGFNANAVGLAVQPDGKVLAAGTEWSSGGSAIAVARYLGDPDPAEQLAALRGRIVGAGPGDSLPRKLDAVAAALATGDTATSCAVLNGFDAEVQAQAGKHVPSVDAAALLGAAAEIERELGCS